jgi:hypothetical protein
LFDVPTESANDPWQNPNATDGGFGFAEPTRERKLLE